MAPSNRHLSDEGSRFQAAVAGGFSGLVARLFTAPLDVLKIRMQLQPQLQGKSTGQRETIPHIISNLYKQSGLHAFWRGNVSATWLYVIYNMTQFTAYRAITPLVEKSGLPVSIATSSSGALAGTIATTSAYPFDLIRTRFAAQGAVKVYATFRSSILSIFRSEGISGFYRGLNIAIFQNAPYMGLLFGIYEAIRPLVSKLNLPFTSDDAMAGALASGLAKTGTYPLDLIRKRVQMQGPERHRFADGRIPEYENGFWRTGKAIIRREGWRGLYRGLTIGLIKATPTSTVSMWSYGIAIRALERYC